MSATLTTGTSRATRPAQAAASVPARLRAGVAVLACLALAAVCGPWLSPWGYEEQDMGAVLQTASTTHWLGTDRLGRDLLTRLLVGARISLVVALAATAVSMTIGIVWGAVAGWKGGAVDRVLMRIVDGLYSLPDLLLVIGVGLVFGRGTIGLVLALALVSWVPVARVVRAEMVALRERPFVEAARAVGFSEHAIVWRHLMPHLRTPIGITLAYRIPTVIIAESTLSFLGVGLRPPLSSWGVLAADGWQAMAFHPHLILWPSVAILLTVLGFRLIADGWERMASRRSSLH